LKDSLAAKTFADQRNEAMVTSGMGHRWTGGRSISLPLKKETRVDMNRKLVKSPKKKSLTGEASGVYIIGGKKKG